MYIIFLILCCCWLLAVGCWLCVSLSVCLFKCESRYYILLPVPFVSLAHNTRGCNEHSCKVHTLYMHRKQNITQIVRTGKMHYSIIITPVKSTSSFITIIIIIIEKWCEEERRTDFAWDDFKRNIQFRYRIKWNENEMEYYTLSCDRDGLYVVVVVVEAIIRYSKINRSHFMINCSYKCSYSLYFNRLILRDTFVTTTKTRVTEKWARNYNNF